MSVYPFRLRDRAYAVRLHAGGRATLDGAAESGEVHVRRLDETTFEVIAEQTGTRRLVHAVARDRDDDDGGFWLWSDGDSFEVEPVEDRPGTDRRPSGAPSLTAPMPSTVLQVLATPGQRVRAGDTIVLLEAMKMEFPLRAPRDGTIESISCREGDLVKPGIPLVILAPDA